MFFIPATEYFKNNSIMKKKLTTIRILTARLAMTLVLAMLTATTAWAQTVQFPTASGGSGTADDPYQIKTIDDLNKLAEDVNSETNYRGTYFKLMNDIDMSGVENFTPIGLGSFFRGSFDGNNHTISNLTINNTGNYPVGLFGNMWNAVVQNLTIRNANITGVGAVGGIVGQNLSGTITNCHVIGATITATYTKQTEVGAIIANNVSGSLTGNTYCNTFVYTPNYSDGGIHSNGDAFNIGTGHTGTSSGSSNTTQGDVEGAVFGKRLYLYDGASNATMLAAYASPASYTAHSSSAPDLSDLTVILDGRTLYTDGDWNTLCLPFALSSLSGTPLEGFRVKELDTETAYSGHLTGLDGTTLYLNFKDADSIVAGKPYIVKKTDMTETSVTPTITATSGTAGSTAQQGYDKLVDGSTSGYRWRTSISEGNPSYCEFHADQLVNVTGYTLTTGNQQTTGDPTVWTLYGKQNEGDAWTAIDSRNATTTPSDALPTGRTEGKSYTAQNPGTYQYFRFEVTQTGGNFLCLTELTLQCNAVVPNNIVNPVFSGVTINSDDPTPVTFPGGQFMGTYSPVVLTPNDKSNLFLGAANTLYYPNAANSTDGNYYVNACRAYFHVDLGGQANAVRAFVLNFGEDEATGIREITNPTPNPSPAWEGSGCAWYSLDGRRLSGKPSKSGVYINAGKKIVIK